jgi:hypothetical protein
MAEIGSKSRSSPSHHSQLRCRYECLTDRQNLLSTAGQGFQPKRVVHSGHGFVTWTSERRHANHISTLFHIYLIDIYEESTVGVFFTKMERRLVAGSFRRGAKPPCTDLSTDGVDKSESLFITGTCVIFVKELTAC